MKRAVIGVIGHVDHGKTALVRALTGQETDRLPEEKRRGISIALGFAHMRDDDRHIDFIDMPGHERFVRTMIAGATGIDAVLLVVSANEGIKPQTLEHIDIAGLLGIRQAVIAVSKADLVSGDEAASMAGEVAGLVRAKGIAAPAPVITSSLNISGIGDLKALLAVIADGLPPRAADGIPFLPIDRAFTMAGHGPVVTGTLRGGFIAAGDVLRLFPAGRDVRVKAVQAQGGRTERAVPGQRTALNLRDVEAADLKRGMTLSAPGLLAPTEWLTLSLRSLGDAPPLNNGMRLQALFGTSEVETRLRLLDRNVLEPGQTAFVQVHFQQPVATPAREHIVLRLLSPSRTVAGGLILDTHLQRQRRNHPALLRRLDELLNLPPAELFASEIKRAGGAGVTTEVLSRLSALHPVRVRQMLAELPTALTLHDLVVDAAQIEGAAAKILSALGKNVAGLSSEMLIGALPGFNKAVVDEAIQRLVAGKKVEWRDGRVTIPRPAEDQARDLRDVQLATRLGEILRKAGLTPPTPKELIGNVDDKRALDRLVKAGVIIRGMDTGEKREMLFHRDAVEVAQRILRPLLEKGAGLSVSEIGAALKITRKYSIPLLDHLDRARFTRRLNDRRVLADGAKTATGA